MLIRSRCLWIGALCAFALGCPQTPEAEPPVDEAPDEGSPDVGAPDTGPVADPDAPDTAVGGDLDPADDGEPIEPDISGCADDSECESANQCTVGICAVGGQCKYVPLGGGCDDGNHCTTDDLCVGDKCVGNQIFCGDDNPCTNDSCLDGSCEFVFNADPCDDGNACTKDDHCKNGLCAFLEGTTCDDGSVCTTDACNPETGECEFLAFVDGSPCDDGEVCNVGETCLAGVCQGGFEPNCDDEQLCTDDTCDPLTGFCLNTPNEEPCDDDSECTSEDVCAGGTCSGGIPTDCSDGDVCTDDVCDDATGGCSNPFNIKPCEDGDPCTSGDACHDGLCISGELPSCDDANACTTDFCAPETGECTYLPSESTSCEDGNQCTLFDSCLEAVCVPGEPKVCDDGNQCTTDSCEPKTGDCVAVSAEGAPCDNGDLCTSEDVCEEAACLAGQLMDCDDGNPCTEGEGCQGGECYAGAPVNCDDGKECTADDCDPEGEGCTHAPEEDGLVCILPSACDVATCLAGECQVDEALDCNDDNPCTTDICSPQTGCQNTPLTCEAESSVQCLTAGCDPAVGGCSFVTDDSLCNDGIACSEDACAPAIGCSHTYPEGCCQDQPLLEDFGDGAPGWSLGGGPSVKWQVVSGEQSTSGLSSLYYGNPAQWNFSSGSTNSGNATSPSFTVPSSGSPKLQFRVWMHTESSSTYDKFFLYLQPSNVQLWSKVGISMQKWTLVTIPLGSYKGQTVSLRFDFNSIDSVANTTKGIFVDEVRVLGCD